MRDVYVNSFLYTLMDRQQRGRSGLWLKSSEVNMLMHYKTLCAHQSLIFDGGHFGGCLEFYDHVACENGDT